MASSLGAPVQLNTQPSVDEPPQDLPNNNSNELFIKKNTPNCNYVYEIFMNYFFKYIR